MTSTLTYDVYVADPIPQHSTALVPNGDKREFSPLSITLISGDHDAVLVDPPMTIAQTAAVGDRVAASGKNLTHIFVTHGHGDHWFGASELAARFGADVVATAGTIEQMHKNRTIREVFWNALFPGQIPVTDVIVEPVVGGRLDLEGHALNVVEVGHSDTDDTSVLHVPSIELVLDDDAGRTIRETREYLVAAGELLAIHDNALDFFTAMLDRYPDRLNPGALWGGAVALYR